MTEPVTKSMATSLYLTMLEEAEESDLKYLEAYDEDQIALHCAEEMAEASAAIIKYLRIKEKRGTAASIGLEKATENAESELADALSTGYLLVRKKNLMGHILHTHLKKSKEFAKLI